MRTLLAILTSLSVTGCSVFGVGSEIEEPDYRVVERPAENLEIRRYEPRVAAQARVPLTGEDGDARSRAFRLLFDYISGANEPAEEIEMTAPVATEDTSGKIEMTAPVATRQTDGEMVMRFYLPERYSEETAPKPTNPKVEIVTEPAGHVAVLRFSGSRDEEAVEARTDELLAAVQDLQWHAVDAPAAYFYDPPWTLWFLRRNEVAMPVERR
jgi:hypothetical protein